MLETKAYRHTTYVIPDSLRAQLHGKRVLSLNKVPTNTRCSVSNTHNISHPLHKLVGVSYMVLT